ncbi:carboxypeptidase regulatory-like domain-containing protein [Sphingomonas sp. A2-49]|uniref:carboxypeptidase regulatory-like domain-containing protein n=1 Tax=Sphingomonas sp. A2-49 TaxID=1391375 RepID=UPI0021D3BFD3|nr:carboxypeptidase regulatory-like domain-containing protein [Sphingomonas sp. A2-49]MCU6452466.1 carboxypeptidase regulatory-like domain-containing protein [Sphingomonas sp. A2-49]
MTPERIVALLLGLAVLLGWLRLVRGGVLGQAPWRAAALLLLQPIVATLLYATLFGGSVQRGHPALVVATGGTGRLVTAAPDETLVALPEARGVAGATPVPDLATALRRWPAVSRLRIVGDGLPARDRPAARMRTVAYDPPSPPTGIIDIVPPKLLAPGDTFAVAMRVGGGGRVALVDPAGRPVDAGAPDRDGRLVLHGVARDAGTVLFGLRIGDADVAAVPVVTAAAAPARVLILAAAPGPEVKFLRRWASDAGLAPATRLAVGGGLTLGDPDSTITPATLARTDLAILDDRSWAGLGGAARAAIAAAVRGGMGLVVRLTGPVPRGWQVLGLPVSGSRDAPLRLAPAAPTDAMLAARRGPGSRDAPVSSAAPLGETPVLTRIDAPLDAGIPLLRDARGTPFAAWRGVGRGRVAATTILDSFALATSGNGDAYAFLWSTIASTVGRGAAAGAAPPARVDPLAFVGDRVTVCGVRDGARIVAPDGGVVALVRDPVAGDCAGYWPRAAGWHRIAGQGGAAFYVQPAAALASLRRARDQAATVLLVSERAPVAAAPLPGEPQPGWRWLVPFLLAAGLTWWLERSRLGVSRRR